MHLARMYALFLLLFAAPPTWAQEGLADKLEDSAPEITLPSAPQTHLDLDADAAYRRCRGFVAGGHRDRALACYQAVIDGSPKSEAASMAAAAIDVLQAQRSAAQNQVQRPERPRLAPGRLELVTTAGAFGIWNATAGAMVLGANAKVPGLISAAGGGVAVGLGGVFALSSFFLSEALKPTAGTSRMLSSGMVWGSAVGISMAPWAFTLAGADWPTDSLLPPLDLKRGLPAAITVSVLAGHAGLVGALALSRVTSFEPEQVSTMNTGGAVGFAAGLALTPLVRTFGLPGPGWMGLTFSTSTLLGLVGGFAMANAVHLSQWEILLIDLATTLGVAAGGAAGLVAATVLSRLPGSQALGGGAVLLGLTTSLLGSTAGIAYFRIRRGEPFSRLGTIPIDAVFAPPQVRLDKAGKPFVSIPLTVRF